MFDLSGILKKYQETKKTPRKEKGPPRESRSPPPAQPASVGKVSISHLVDSQSARLASEPRAREIYDASVAAVKTLYERSRDSEAGGSDEITKIADRVVGFVETDPASLVRLQFLDYPESQEYLYFHAVNTAVISLVLGRALGFERAAQVELVLAGLLHDLALTRYRGTIDKPGPLTAAEFTHVKEHTSAGYDMLKGMDIQLSRKVLEAVCQEHERVDGSGYLRGLSNDAIGDYARILSAADVYEALTHWRSYRRAYTASEAVRVMLDEKKRFDPAVLKALIEHIGIFPAGVLVQLNTKEIALVMKTNSKAPFRPVVDILYDSSGKKLPEPKQIDLSRSTVVYIEECVPGTR
ncbi:MAG: HD domain-containing protein [Candidatus Omnitrophica bacterium]|nr:HD domain-containing protein [Candidatus Omnitrophota bacterium]